MTPEAFGADFMKVKTESGLLSAIQTFFPAFYAEMRRTHDERQALLLENAALKEKLKV